MKPIGKRRIKQLHKQAIHVRFEDECRAVGCGVRPVVIERKGPKWTTIINPLTGRQHKIEARLWERLERSKVNLA